MKIFINYHSLKDSDHFSSLNVFLFLLNVSKTLERKTKHNRISLNDGFIVFFNTIHRSNTPTVINQMRRSENSIELKCF